MEVMQVGWIACADDAPLKDRAFGLPVYTLTGQRGHYLRSWRDGVPEYVALNGVRLVADKVDEDSPMPEAGNA